MTHKKNHHERNQRHFETTWVELETLWNNSDLPTRSCFPQLNLLGFQGFGYTEGLWIFFFSKNPGQLVLGAPQWFWAGVVIIHFDKNELHEQTNAFLHMLWLTRQKNVHRSFSDKIFWQLWSRAVTCSQNSGVLPNLEFFRKKHRKWHRKFCAISKLVKNAPKSFQMIPKRWKSSQNSTEVLHICQKHPKKLPKSSRLF